MVGGPEDGEVPSGVNMHSSEEEMSQSKTVGLGAGRQPGGQIPGESTIVPGRLRRSRNSFGAPTGQMLLQRAR